MDALFDSLPLGAAFLPLGLYLLALGWVHLRDRREFFEKPSETRRRARLRAERRTKRNRLLGV